MVLSAEMLDGQNVIGIADRRPLPPKLIPDIYEVPSQRPEVPVSTPMPDTPVEQAAFYALLDREGRQTIAQAQNPLKGAEVLDRFDTSIQRRIAQIGLLPNEMSSLVGMHEVIHDHNTDTSSSITAALIGDDAQLLVLDIIEGTRKTNAPITRHTAFVQDFLVEEWVLDNGISEIREGSADVPYLRNKLQFLRNPGIAAPIQPPRMI